MVEISENAARSGFNLSKVVKQTVSLIAGDWIAFGGLAIALYALPYIGFGLAAERLAPGDENMALFFSMLTSLTVAPVFLAVVSHRVLGRLEGHRPRMSESLTVGLMLFFPLLGVVLLTNLAIGAAMLLLVIPGLMVATAYAVAIPARVNETSGVFRSLRRSADLTRGHRWSVFGLLMIFLAIYMTILLVAQYAAQAMTGSENTNRVVTLVVEAAWEAFGSLVSTVGSVAVYIELRRVKEGGGPAVIAAVFS